ncbi:MAG: N-6 DNA methylase [Nanoarchaeota archaeon]|nr:N-6 DNA methylase [Nanoarchaeota archaeon]
MRGLSRLKNESLTQFSHRLASCYNAANSKAAKKDKGQFFTPPAVAKYMASFINQSKEEVSILDPGAGIGILSVAVIENLVKQNHVKKIKLTCYETDKTALPYLKKLLDEIKKELNKNMSFGYIILNQDFILSKASVLTTNLLNYNQSQEKFDVIISNPPYFKLNKKDIPIYKFKDIVLGQPNIYFLFMALSSKLLNKDGEMVFITPRSFCSGLYYNKFRKWLIGQVYFANIHLFDSRKDLFTNENVLQENIITHFKKKESKNITIYKTTNGDFSCRQKIKVLKEDVMYRTNGHIFFRIPSTKEELRIIRGLDRLPNNFFKLGIKISTGKVIAFRNKEYLQKSLTKNSLPLLWMHNIKDGRIEWPNTKKDKAIAIKKCNGTKNLLLKTNNYLVLKRFTTKEQKRRFETACIFKTDFKEFEYFALDNMINYIYNPNQSLTKNQIKGIAKYLSLPIVDSYFRILNGHTQVNANEVYALPFPSLVQLEDFGKEKTSIQTFRNKLTLNNIQENQTIEIPA